MRSPFADVQQFYDGKNAEGIRFSLPPTMQDFGGVLAQFEDSEGANCSVATLARAA